MKITKIAYAAIAVGIISASVSQPAYSIDAKDVYNKILKLYKDKADCKVLCTSATCDKSFGRFSKKYVGSACKARCQTKHSTTIGGVAYEIKERYGEGWDIKSCVRAYNNKMGKTTGKTPTSIAVYNQAELEQIHAAESKGASDGEGAKADLKLFYENTAAVQ